MMQPTDLDMSASLNRWSQSPAPATPLHVAVICQDAVAREQVQPLVDTITYRSGERPRLQTDWQVGDLKDPKIFSEGVGALARADIIVASMQEGRRLPPPFYLWVNLWLQVRGERPGTLVSLIAPAADLTLHASETRRYLSAVASQGRLVWIEAEHPDAPLHRFGPPAAWARAA